MEKPWSDVIPSEARDLLFAKCEADCSHKTFDFRSMGVSSEIHSRSGELCRGISFLVWSRVFAG